jgi:hypothetical protein
MLELWHREFVDDAGSSISAAAAAA